MKKKIALIVKLTITLALLYFAVSRVDLGFVLARVQRLSVIWFVAAVLALGVQAIFAALRWRVILNKCGALVTKSDAVRYTLVSLFFSQMLPSTVGGDAARIWLVARDGAGWSKAIYSVAIDRFAGVFVLALIVLACIPELFTLIDDRLGRTGLLGLGLLGVAISIRSLASANGNGTYFIAFRF